MIFQRHNIIDCNASDDLTTDDHSRDRGEQSMYRATVLNNTNNIAFSMHYSTQSDAVSLDLVPFVENDLVERLTLDTVICLFSR